MNQENPPIPSLHCMLICVLGSSYSDDERTALFQLINTSKDGQINKKEFIKAFTVKKNVTFQRNVMQGIMDSIRSGKWLVCLGYHPKEAGLAQLQQQPSNHRSCPPSFLSMLQRSAAQPYPCSRDRLLNSNPPPASCLLSFPLSPTPRRLTVSF